LHNAVLESFCLHSRNLLDFLFAEKPYPDDVIAEDYFESPEDWPRIRGDMPPVLEPVRRRVGKELAHLTYARLQVTPEAKQRHFLEIAAALDQAMGTFLRNVSNENLSQKWKQPPPIVVDS